MGAMPADARSGPINALPKVSAPPLPIIICALAALAAFSNCKVPPLAPPILKVGADGELLSMPSVLRISDPPPLILKVKGAAVEVNRMVPAVVGAEFTVTVVAAFPPLKVATVVAGSPVTPGKVGTTP